MASRLVLAPSVPHLRVEGAYEAFDLGFPSPSPLRREHVIHTRGGEPLGFPLYTIAFDCDGDSDGDGDGSRHHYSLLLPGHPLRRNHDDCFQQRVQTQSTISTSCTYLHTI